MNHATANWINSGMAQESARDLAWFVVIMFIVIGYLLYRDFKKEERDAQK